MVEALAYCDGVYPCGNMRLALEDPEAPENLYEGLLGYILGFRPVEAYSAAQVIYFVIISAEES